MEELADRSAKLVMWNCAKLKNSVINDKNMNLLYEIRRV